MYIGDIAIIPLTLATVEGVKSILGTKGKTNQLIAVLVGIILAIASQVVTEQLVSADVALWIEIITKSLSYGLAAIGLFDLALRNQYSYSRTE